jgi:hypothetical protein
MKIKYDKRYTKDGIRIIFTCGKCTNPNFMVRETKKYRIFQCTECYKEAKELY